MTAQLQSIVFIFSIHIPWVGHFQMTLNINQVMTLTLFYLCSGSSDKVLPGICGARWEQSCECVIVTTWGESTSPAGASYVGRGQSTPTSRRKYPRTESRNTDYSRYNKGRWFILLLNSVFVTLEFLFNKIKCGFVVLKQEYWLLSLLTEKQHFVVLSAKGAKSRSFPSHLSVTL